MGKIDSQQEGNFLPNDSNMTTVTASYIPAPPPFDPLTPSLTSASTSAATMVSNSVVPDLMRVYESLTQSKTPDTVPPQYQSQHSKSDDQHGYMSGSSSISGSNRDAAVKSESSQFHQKDDQETSENRHPFMYHNPQHIEHPLRQGTIHHHLRQIVAPYSGYPNAQRPPKSPVLSTTSIYPSPMGQSMRAEDDKGYSSSGSVESSKAGGKKRKGGTKRKNDKKDKDGRWTKRFTWPEDLHRDFVAAIFDVGLKHSSPATVLEQMAPHHQVTTERVKSHLQKYRLHRQKSKQDFMTDYEATVRKLQQSGYEGVDALAGGKVAAHVAFATMTNQSTTAPLIRTKTPSNDTKQPVGIQADPIPSAQLAANEPKPSLGMETLVLPKLTEAEKNSPIGASMGFLMGLFFSLKQQLDAQRQQRQLHSKPLQSEQETPPNPMQPSPPHQNQQQSSIQAPHQYHDTAIVTAAVAAAAAAAPCGNNSAEAEQQGLDAYDSFVKTLHTTPSKEVESATPSGTGQAPTVPQSTRSNLEENNMMKQEMRNQMAFQHKIRAMKEQELNKYRVQFGHGINERHDINDSIHYRPTHSHAQSYPQHDPSYDTGNDQSRSSTNHPHNSQSGIYHQEDVDHQHEQEDVGEASAIVVDDSLARTRNLSLGEEADFWNSDAVDDDQLFEFLMDES